MYTCNDFAMPHVLAITAHGACHHLLVLPQSATAYTVAYTGGRTFEREATNSFKKGGGLISKGGPIFRDYGIDISTHKLFLKAIWYYEHKKINNEWGS